MRNLPLGIATQGKPLLVVRKIEEKKIVFDLWDEEGKRRINQEVTKTQEPAMTVQSLDMKLMGARSKTSWLVSIRGKRTLVHADDWIIFDQNKFEIVETEEEIDEYIQGVLKVEMVVLEGMERDQQGAYLKAHVFSPSHAQSQSVRITMQPPANQKAQETTKKIIPTEQQEKHAPLNAKAEEENDEDDEFDEEEDSEDEFEYM
jgi:hypothetical protein